MIMIDKNYLIVCLLMCLAMSSSAESRDVVLTEHEVSIWKKMEESPLLMTVNLNNAQDEKVFFVGQPILLNVGILNRLAYSLHEIPEPEMRAIKSNGVDVARARIKLCDQSSSWFSFVKVYIGVSEENVVWCGDMSSASNCVWRSNQVDINPVGITEYIPELESCHAGQYQIWAVFDNTSLNAGVNPDFSRFRVKSELTAFRVITPTNAHQKAWVLAEKGSRARTRKQYDAAATFLTQAIKTDPLLGRGPLINNYRIFDLNWELVDMYERQGRYSDAVRAAEQTRIYAETLPKSARDELMTKIDDRISCLQKKGDKRGANVSK
jgi:hypothetical protein